MENTNTNSSNKATVQSQQADKAKQDAEYRKALGYGKAKDAAKLARGRHVAGM